MKTHLTPLAAALLAASFSAQAQVSVTYVDSNTSNTAAFDTTSYPGESWIGGHLGDDDLWAQRSFGNENAVYTSNDINKSGKEDAPGLVMTLSGLTPGEKYLIQGYFWSASGDNWRFKGSLTETPPLASDPTVSFSRIGSGTSTNAPALAQGVDGSDNLGVTYTDDGSGTWTSTSYFTAGIMIGEGNRKLYQASLGKATADGSGNILVYIDDLENTGSSNRSWFDGVGHLPVDSEPDGMDDDWEVANGLIVGVDDSGLNPDGDGLTNIEEFNNDTNPQQPDTDFDGLNDDVEVAGPSDPLDPDSDDNYFLDGIEVDRGTNPVDPLEIPYPPTGFIVDFSSDASSGQTGPIHNQDSYPFVAAHEVDSVTDPAIAVDRSVTWPITSLGGSDVTVTISYPDTTDNRVMQMIGRPAEWADTYVGTELDLVRDFVGIDARSASGGNGTETPTTMRLNLTPATTSMPATPSKGIRKQTGNCLNLPTLPKETPPLTPRICPHRPRANDSTSSSILHRRPGKMLCP